MKGFALPGFHAVSGCDTTETGCLNGESKLSLYVFIMSLLCLHYYWKVFEAVSDEQLVALAELGKNPEITSHIVVKSNSTLVEFTSSILKVPVWQN